MRESIGYYVLYLALQKESMDFKVIFKEDWTGLTGFDKQFSMGK